MAAKSKEETRPKTVVEEVAPEEPSEVAEAAVVREMRKQPSSVAEEKPVEEVSVEETPAPKVEMPPDMSGNEPVVDSVASSDKPEEEVVEPKRRSVKGILLFVVVVVVVLGALAGGVYVYVNGMKDSGEGATEESETQEFVPTEAPTPTPEAMEEVDLSEYSVSVLNGSGVPGAASEGQEVLESADFVVAETGNASNYDFEATVIQVKSGVPASVVDKLKTALEEEYEVEVGDTLAESGEFDIVVTVGAK